MKYIVAFVMTMSVLGIKKSSFKEFNTLDEAKSFYVIKAAERDSCLNKNCVQYVSDITIDSIKVR